MNCKEYIKSWQKENAEHLAKYQAEYKKNNPDKVAEWKRNGRIRKGLSPEPRKVMTPEESVAKQKEKYRNRTQEEIDAQNKRYRDKYRIDSEFRKKAYDRLKAWRTKKKT